MAAAERLRPYVLTWTYRVSGNVVGTLDLNPDQPNLEIQFSEMPPMQRTILRAYLQATLDTLNRASKTPST